MAIGVTIFVIAVLIIAIWIIIEARRFKHKLLAFFLIGLVLFSYFSITSVFKGKDVDLTNVSGIIDASKIYFSWLGSFFSNIKSITSKVIQMDWKGNSTIG